jgi:hypothetical protein
MTATTNRPDEKYHTFILALQPMIQTEILGQNAKQGTVRTRTAGGTGSLLQPSDFTQKLTMSVMAMLRQERREPL